MIRNLAEILGIGVDTFTKDSALEYIEKKRGHVVTINPEMIINANKNSEFKEIINNADLVIPDGIGVEIGLKILGHRVKRIAGIEFGKELLYNAAKSGGKVALIGAKPEVISLAKKKLESEFENLNIIYTHDGYFAQPTEIYEKLIETAPDLILVALGSPKQEMFISKIKDKLPNSIMIGLGGSFDVWSGMSKRAPLIYQKMGLEWLYRAIKEPKRFKRIFPTIPLFLLNVLVERITKK